MKKLWLGFLLVFLVQGATYGQTAAIEGRVVEAETSEPIPSVNVVAQAVGATDSEARFVASTDADGRFRLEGLPAGAYEVRSTGIQYVAAQQRVELGDGESASLVFRLEVHPYQLGEIVVNANRLGEKTPATRRHLSTVEIELQDPATVADVAQIIPAAHVHTNSRGQTILYFRNSEDRQMAQFFEGALLNIPWDNRVDLGMLPAAMLQGVTASTGVPSVHYGANVIGGAVNFHPRLLEQPGEATRVKAALGMSKAQRGSAVHMRRKGNFSLTAAVDYAGRDDVPLADNSFPTADTVFSQPSGDTRVNTDRWLASGFLRGAYQFDGGARLSVSGFHVDGEHGIAPESNVNPAVTGVRYWRYPTWRKSMFIVSGALPLDTWMGGEGALLRGAAWFNRFEQDIHQFTDVSYDRLGETQNDIDYTGGARLIAELPAGQGSLALSANALTSRHWQNIHAYANGAPGPDSINVYRQHILSLGAEYDVAVADRLDARAGASINGSIMADTGPFPERDPFWDWDLTGGLVYEASDQIALSAAAGRKTRFPTMRELFDAALGKFVVNPDLGAISARMVEVGIERLGTRVSGSATAFFEKTDGAIAQRTIQVGPDAGKEQRINLGGSRTYGIELVAGAAPSERLRVDGQMTWMHTRALFEGETVKRNEKPAWLGQLTATYDLPVGVDVMGQLEFLGGAFARTEQNTFITLPSAAIIDARLSYPFDLSSDGQADDEVFVRVENLTDDVLLLQLGLPGPGRSFLSGVNITL